MTATCPECGARLPDGGACIELFHALLLLEYEVAHFYAVTSYVLRHPEGMGYTPEALAGAWRGLSDHLAGRVSLADQRSRVRLAADSPAPITRRAGDVVLRWPVEGRPLTVADVIDRGVEGYVERVADRARAIVRRLDGVTARS